MQAIQQLTVLEQLKHKAQVHCKVSSKYRTRTDALIAAMDELESYARLTNTDFHRSDIRAVSRRAAKSTKYTIQCRIGTGELVPTITFRDSLNGESSTYIDFGIYRKVCSNGLHIATNEELIYKQNHLNDWRLDSNTIVNLFTKAVELQSKVVQKYSSIQVNMIERPIIMRNRILERLATNGLITESQASVAIRYPMYYYDAQGDLFGIVNAVQESLTTNRNGQKKLTDANSQLNRKLLPAIDNALVELYNIAA